MKILLVVDLQKQFRDGFGRYERCLEYIKSHREEYDRVVATVFRQDRSLNDNYAKLKWDGCMEASEDDLEFTPDLTLIKHGYGLPCGVFSDKDEYFVMGCETDACVLATCFNLWDDGLNFTVLEDYIYTTGEYLMPELMKIYERNFGISRKRGVVEFFKTMLER